MDIYRFRDCSVRGMRGCTTFSCGLMSNELQDKSSKLKMIIHIDPSLSGDLPALLSM